MGQSSIYSVCTEWDGEEMAPALKELAGQQHQEQEREWPGSAPILCFRVLGCSLGGLALHFGL